VTGSAGEQPPPVTADTPVDGVLDVALDADTLYAMRAAVAAHASAFGLAEPKIEKLLVVATELAANSLRHGGGCAALRLWCQDNTVYCQVTDEGPGIGDPATVGTGPIPLTADGGRGLWLVRQLADDLTIVNHHPGSTVTASVRL
jgi:anti-sigma regulatory factor (Ser/Thr protein kinase)